MSRLFFLLIPACCTSLLASVICYPTSAQSVTSDGWEEASKGLTFYLEVPMIDNKEIDNYGIGGNITAEGIINAVRYADAHPKIKHVAFKMNTGGGSLMHAEAMEDIIARHHKDMQYHIVVKNAISAGIWTAFSCDNIFMVPGGTIGGATAYYQTAGGTSIVADDIPYIAAQLELTAKHNGYPREIIKPLMDMQSELHVWSDPKGQKVLSNSPPKNRDKVTGYKHMDQKNTVLTLTSIDAVKIGIAKDINKFDTRLIGNKINAQGWTRGNRYGEVVGEIGWVYNSARVLEDYWVAQKHKLHSFPVTSYNRNNRRTKEMLVNRRKHNAVLTSLREINHVLNKLPDIHPERHLYLEGENKTTILADQEQWKKDALETFALTSQLTKSIQSLTRAYEALGVDARNIKHIADPIRDITLRIKRIKIYGNVAYWDSVDP